MRGGGLSGQVSLPTHPPTRGDTYPPYKDIDQKSLAYAQAQVERNNLSNRIQIVETTPDAPFFDLDKLGISKLDFTMCNPPFYNSPSSHAPPPSSSLNSTGSESTIRKRLPPYSPTCRGTPTEMCTPGGELAFATRMVHESVLPPVRTRIQWFSIMLGLKSSVAGLISELKARGAANWAVTTFIQGRGSAGKRTGTRRWAVAWSFRGWRPGWGHHVCGIHNPPPGIKPFKGIFELVVPADIQKPKGVLDKLVEVLAEIKLAAQGAGVDRGGVIWWDMKWESHNGKDICDGTGEGTVYGWVTGDLWSRKARRTRERELRETGTGIGVGGVAGSGGERARVPDPQENELDEEKLMGMWFRISVKAAAPTTTTTIDNATTEEDGLDEEMSNAPAWGEHCQGEYTHTHTHTTLAEPEPATDKDLAKMSQQTQVTVRWVRGRPGDSVLFESFCGMLRRKILTC